MKQLRIIHLSDLHFGSQHRFKPEDPTHPRAGYPDLFTSITTDLNSFAFDDPTWASTSDPTQSPLLIAATGDLTTICSPAEFKAAYEFFSRFKNAKIMGSTLSLAHLFIVPGNHDVNYNLEDEEARASAFSNFYTKLYSGVRPAIPPHQAAHLSQIHFLPAIGCIVAEINTALYVRHNTDDEHRGCVDLAAVAQLESQLKAIPESDRKNAIRIALLHHHPILIPELLEVDRDYDAVANSRHLLGLLRRYGFHLVLHGHKHYPSLFSYDSDSIWDDQVQPAMIVYGGGSVGSRALPIGKQQNTYAVFSMKWDSDAGVARLRAVTRGLTSNDGAGEMPPHHWQWKTLRDSDRLLTHPTPPPIPVSPHISEYQDTGQETHRQAVYKATRLNLPVCTVAPSLIPNQAYEVRCWIVPHCDHNGTPKPGWVAPIRVVWSAGQMFPMVECRREDDVSMSATFNYYGPFLIQAELHFAEGEPARVHTYASMPGFRTLNKARSSAVATPTSFTSEQ